MLTRPIVTFDDLERLRGRLVSISLVCPLARLYIREMNQALQYGEEALLVITLWKNFSYFKFQYELQITPDLLEEIETWIKDPYFLESRRNFTEVHEQDIKLFYGNIIIFKPYLFKF